MDIRDLKIGDYVLYNNNQYKVKEIGHGYIAAKNDSDVIYCVVSMVEPIPLTDDLLDKIGIKFLIGNNASRTYSIGYCSLEKIVNTNYYTFTAEAGKLNIRTKKHIKFLHELQHELYDAGVEFKIEL